MPDKKSSLVLAELSQGAAEAGQIFISGKAARSPRAESDTIAAAIWGLTAAVYQAASQIAIANEKEEARKCQTTRE